MRYSSSFASLKNNPLSRKFGGYKTGVADPYVTGYHFIYFTKFPAITTPSWCGCGPMESDEIRTVLQSTCLSVTPPGGTLNKIEFTGLGGIKWSVPGNIDYGNTISIKFLEMQGLPVINSMHNWIKTIRDYRHGVSQLKEDKYTNSNYTAVMYFWTTAPDAVTIEYAACYDGMFPSKDPQDLLTSDVETQGKLEVEIEFNVDYAWHEEWVYKKCKELAPAMSEKKTTIANYGQSLG